MLPSPLLSGSLMEPRNGTTFFHGAGLAAPVVGMVLLVGAVLLWIGVVWACYSLRKKKRIKFLEDFPQGIEKRTGAQRVAVHVRTPIEVADLKKILGEREAGRNTTPPPTWDVWETLRIPSPEVVEDAGFVSADVFTNNPDRICILVDEDSILEDKVFI